MSGGPIPMRELAAALVLAGYEVHVNHIGEVDLPCGTTVAYSGGKPATHWPCEVWGPGANQRDGTASSIADVLYLLDPDEDRAAARERADWTAGRVLSEDDAERGQASMDLALVDKLTRAAIKRAEETAELRELRAERDRLRAEVFRLEMDRDSVPLLTLTAFVVEAGGALNPGVTFEIGPDTVTADCTREQAAALGAHLYREVTLTLSPAPATVPTDGAGEGVP